MATHSAVGDVLVSVWVPELGDNRLSWHPCTDLPFPLGGERIATCEDTGSVLRAQGALVARLLTPGKYHGIRLTITDGRTGELVGLAEWYSSPETGAYLPYPGGAWSACDYGQHEHHQDDTEEPAVSLAA
ncbi:hypothetical protein BU196_00485 [Streptomyces sp. CBMA370]|nr:hypothetical protein [Streptomyces sp. CBMA370]